MEWIHHSLFSPKINFWEHQAHWKGAWSVGDQLPGHIHILPSSLLLFLSSYPEIYFSIARVVSLAWKSEYCGGQGYKSRAWFNIM